MLMKETHQLDSSILDHEVHETGSIWKNIYKHSDLFVTQWNITQYCVSDT